MECRCYRVYYTSTNNEFDLNNVLCEESVNPNIISVLNLQQQVNYTCNNLYLMCVSRLNDSVNEKSTCVDQSHFVAGKRNLINYIYNYTYTDKMLFSIYRYLIFFYCLIFILKITFCRSRHSLRENRTCKFIKYA